MSAAARIQAARSAKLVERYVSKVRAACSTLASTSAEVCCSNVASTLPVVGFTVVKAMAMSLGAGPRAPPSILWLAAGLEREPPDAGHGGQDPDQGRHGLDDLVLSALCHRPMLPP